MNWTEGDVTLGGVRIHYYRRGTGRPLVLAHGFSDNGLCWERVAASLDDHYDIVAYDSRFHGKSDAPADGEFGDADDLIGLVKALGLQRPAVLGHSMGAATVADAIGREPGLFRRAVLEDPPWRDEWPVGARPQQPNWSEITVEQVIAYGKQQSPTWDAAEFPAWAESKRQLRVPADWGTRRPSFLGAWRDRVTAIGVPALLIRGDNIERGAIVSEDVAAEAQRLNAKVEVVCLKGAGHNVRREAFDDYVGVVGEFLDRD
ncbi:MAG: alpha/beta fold hydrolase [Dehalococcoidia bacterium]